MIRKSMMIFTLTLFVLIGCAENSEETMNPNLGKMLLTTIQYHDRIFLGEGDALDEQEQKEMEQFFRKLQLELHENGEKYFGVEGESIGYEQDWVESIISPKNPEDYKQAREQAAKYLDID